MIDNILSKMERQAKGKKDLQETVDLLKRVKTYLDQGHCLRTYVCSKQERDLLASYPFLTQKKVLYVANVDEESLPSMHNHFVSQVEAYAAKEGSFVIPICSKLEEEMAQLSPEEANEFLHTLGLQETGLDRLIKASFSLLNLITYITTGEIETRAWTISKGTSACEAAGKIHSDIQKGFIRAEIVSYDDMVACQGRARAKELGKARSEGKEYIVQDGDVILFFHNL